VRKDTLEQLQAFRRRQEEAERKALEAENAAAPAVEDPQWVAPGKKRKKSEKDGGLLKGVKLRRASSGAAAAADAKKIPAAPGKEEKAPKDGGLPSSSTTAPNAQPSTSSTGEKTAPLKSPAATAKPGTAASATPQPSKPAALNLGYGSSDEDD
jgi:hypothetical protein